MKKRILSLALALALCLGLSVPAAAAEQASGFLDSGSDSVDKLSKEEIARLLEENPLTLPDHVFDQVPSCSAPYSAGKVKTSALQAAADRLSALRQIAGLPAVQLDLTLSEQAQYGAVIIAAQGALSHNPSKPADMDSGFYQKAYDATSSSNLYAGMTLTTAVDGFMDDSDASNIDRLGHRRWQLNPGLGKIGFGYAESDTRYRTYVAEKVFDRSGTCSDYEFVAWPASGNFPNSLRGFEENTAWSVSLNPGRYSTPRQGDLTVTLTRESDGRTWTFRGSGYTASGSGSYFHVDTGNYGVANCIIFRPDGVERYEGVYTVEIDGLKSARGTPVDFAYQVDFFDPDNLGAEPEQPAQPEEPEQPAQSSVTLSPVEPNGYEPLYTSWGVEFSNMPRTVSPDETEYVFPKGTVMYVPDLENSIMVSARAGDYPWIDPTGESNNAFSGPVTLKQFYIQSASGEWETLSIPAGGGYIALEPGALYKAEFDYRSVYEQKTYHYQPTFRADSSEEGTAPAGFQAVYTDERFQASEQPLESENYGLQLTFPAGTVFYIPPRGAIDSYNGDDDEEYVYTAVNYSLINDQGEYSERSAVPAIGLYLTLEAGETYFVSRTQANIHYEGINEAQWYISAADDPGQTEEPSSAAFSDVPAAHWAYPYVTEMAALGAVSGDGNGQFAPDRSVSTAEFSVMLSNLFFADELAARQGGGNYWWQSYVSVLTDVGVLDGTAAQASGGARSVVEAPMTRYDMAQVMYNLLTAKGAAMPGAAELRSAAGRIADYSAIPETYADAVTAMYAMGCLSGVDSAGTFGGNSPMSRAAACVALCSLLDNI